MPRKSIFVDKPVTPIAGVSRRGFVRQVAAGAGGIVLANKSGITSAFAQASDVIKVGFVSPRTGPLGSSGKATPM